MRLDESRMRDLLFLIGIHEESDFDYMRSRLSLKSKKTKKKKEKMD